MNRPARVHLSAVLLGALAGAGCERVPAPPAASATPPAQAWPRSQKTKSGSFTVTIQPRAARIVVNEHFTLDARVEPGPGAGQPVKVVVDADMPSHGHGMNTTPQTVHEDGLRYRTDGMLFHMEGEWAISVAIATGQGEERVFFPVSVE